MADEKIIDSKQIYDGRVVKLHIETVQLDDGDTYEREVIRHSGAVAILPSTRTGTSTGGSSARARDLLEPPAGQLEPGEPPRSARRELQEEIGMYPEELVELGGFYVAASYTSEFITIHGTRAESVLPGDKDASGSRS